MSNTIPWNETKWAVANAKLGLKRDEICPGLTLDQHAESIAMFDQHGLNSDTMTWKFAVAIVAAKLKQNLLGGFTEEVLDAQL